MTPIALLIAFASAGFGHGDYVAARIILPYACLAIHFGIPTVIVVLSLIQWPGYGFLLDRTKHKCVITIMLLAIHVSLCIWLFNGGSRFIGE